MKLTEYFGLLNELSSEMILGEWTQSVCNTCISVATDNLLPVNYWRSRMKLYLRPDGDFKPFNNGGVDNLMNQMERNNRERRFLELVLNEDTVYELMMVGHSN